MCLHQFPWRLESLNYDNTFVRIHLASKEQQARIPLVGSSAVRFALAGPL